MTEHQQTDQVRRAACAASLHAAGWTWVRVADLLGYQTPESASRAGRRHTAAQASAEAGRSDAAAILSRGTK